jgi:hypothetical protein
MQDLLLVYTWYMGKPAPIYCAGKADAVADVLCGVMCLRCYCPFLNKVHI